MTKEKIREEKVRCENCKFYNRDYVKLNSRLFPTARGICGNPEVKKKEKKCTENCDLWEDGFSSFSKRKEHIESVLREMSVRLSEISLILESDVWEKERF